ncbi:MAG: DegQ family serine endoprotease [Alphaproteobacteria bacterium]|nr:DegQ family serine endoprotease [Alphaproteobacteria bacterium]
MFETLARRATTALCIATFAAGMFAAAPVGAQDRLPAPGAPAAGFADLAERLLPAVVNISTTQVVRPQGGAPGQPGQPNQRRPETPQFPPGSPFEEFFKEFFDRQGRGGNSPDQAPRRATSLGSGFIIDASGIVVTNNHVIAEADEIKVILQDNTQLSAKLLGRDPKTDLAVLKVESSKPLPAVSLGNSDGVRIGDWVLAIGNPFGLGGTVTAGILSARARDINAGPYDDFLQTDASINRGNSGGPLFNMAGEVIGINTAIYSPSGGSIGIGFSIPSSLAKPVIEQLRDFGRTRRGWLGVNIQNVTDEIAESLGLDKAKGALVARVMEKGPAEKSGIQSGDVIVKFDGKDVTDMRRLPRLVAETPVGKAVKVDVWRKNQAVTLDVTLGELEESEQQATQTQRPRPQQQGAASIEALGMTLTALTPELREKFQVPERTKGVLVTKVDDGSTAAERGLRAGDVIVEVAQQEVTQPSQVVDKVQEARKANRRSVLVMVERAGEQRFVGLPVDPRG